jgi:uncharacterized Fe-S center protein
MGPRSGPALSFCYAVIEKMSLNSTRRLLVLADLNSTPRKLQMVVRNYLLTDLKVAEDITTADSNYTILGFKLHAENGGASYAQATTSPEVSRKKHRTCSQHRFKT